MKFAILDSFMECDIEKKICKGNDFICYEARTEEDLPDDIEELDGCMLWHYINITERTLARLKRCKVIVRIGVGYDSVDIKAAGERGIAVCNVPDYGTNDVADHTMALLLAASRSITLYDVALHNNILSSWRPEIGGDIFRLTDANLGVIGMGRIGHAVALRAQAFGMNVSFYDPYLPDGYDKSYHIKRVESLDDLFAKSQYITIHAPLTDETRGMINGKLFDKVTTPIVLVNTARGGIVLLDDVYDAMKSGKIRKFAADVLQTEPPSEEYKIIQAFMNKEQDICDKVILTPHAAFYARQSQIEMREKAAKILMDMASGKRLRTCVNKEFIMNSRI